MTSEIELPEDVKTAINANRKIEAIKLLRGHWLDGISSPQAMLLVMESRSADSMVDVV